MTTEGETQSMNLDSASLSDIILDQEREADVPIENIRSKVSLTRDAARAISITALKPSGKEPNSWGSWAREVI